VGAVEKTHVNANPTNISVRCCTQLAEFEECVRIQQVVWGEDIVVPAAMFVVALEVGGQVLGAFEGQRMAGFTMAVPGVHDGKIFLHSHMTAVLEELRDRGVGRMLKLFQREDALGRGINLVEWTFDPLELKNARFNLTRLGAVARRFIPNFYGITLSPLHSGLPTDRLVAEWHLDSARVRAVLAEEALPTVKDAVRIAVPADIGEMKQNDTRRALDQQSRIREEFQKWFAAGYVATGIERGPSQVCYVLEPPTQTK
jgi:predicted GNAT superfamily acetyltransferase